MKSSAALTIEASQHVLTLLHKSLPLPLPPRREGTRYLLLTIHYSCAAELVDGLHQGYTGCRHKDSGMDTGTCFSMHTSKA
jgi:hypothetical protein